MTRTRNAALLLFLAAAAIASAQQTGYGRYRLSVQAFPGDDQAAIAQQLAATYRGRVESQSDGAFVVTLPDSAAPMLGNDPRVASVAPMPREVAGNAAGTWFLGPYSYDGAGNVKSIEIPGAPANHINRFVYDALGRLVSGDVAPGRWQEYTYDSFGNITTTKTDGGPVKQLGANAANNRLDITTAAIFGTYDAAGNMTVFNGTDTFAYDALGTVKEAFVDSEQWVYLYTPNNERIVSVAMTGNVQGNSEWTVRDPDGAALRRFSRLNGTWSWEEDYVYRGSALLAAEIPDGARTLHFHLDHLGTPRLITGNGGVQVAKHDYYPFGVEATDPGQDAETMKFTGHERDSANFDYMHARYMRPSIGRFTSTDPGLDVHLRSTQSWNLFSYVRNNPLNATDPDGRVVIWGKRPPPSQMNFFLSGSSNSHQLDRWGQLSSIRNPVTDLTVGEHWRVSAYGAAAFVDGAIPDVPYCEACLVVTDPFVENDAYDVDDPGLRAAQLSGVPTGVVGEAVVGGLVVRATRLGQSSRLFAKTTGWLNRNDFLRIGWSWRGSRRAGEPIFRIVVGGRQRLRWMPAWLRHMDFW